MLSELAAMDAELASILNLQFLLRHIFFVSVRLPPVTVALLAVR